MAVCDKTISQEKEYNCRMYVKGRNRTEILFWGPFPSTKLKHNDLKYDLVRFYSHTPPSYSAQIFSDLGKLFFTGTSSKLVAQLSCSGDRTRVLRITKQSINPLFYNRLLFWIVMINYLSHMSRINPNE